MVKWEYCFYYEEIVGAIPSALTDYKYKNDKTFWDKIVQAGVEGWELVCVTPWNTAGNTVYLVYTFKRPIA